MHWDWGDRLRAWWNRAVQGLYFDAGDWLRVRWVRQSLIALGLLAAAFGLSFLSFLPGVGRLDQWVRGVVMADWDWRRAQDTAAGWQAQAVALVNSPSLDRLRNTVAALGGATAQRDDAPRDATLVLRDGTMPAGAAVPSGPAVPAAAGIAKKFEAYPVAGGQAKLTAGYGWREQPVTKERKMHAGIDLDAPANALVVAVAAGTVAGVGEDREMGKWLELDHGQGMTTYYAHNASVLVQPGESIKPGQTIAKVGRTGRSGTDHLHFEVRIQGKAVDPVPFLPVPKAGP